MVESDQAPKNNNGVLKWCGFVFLGLMLASGLLIHYATWMFYETAAGAWLTADLGYPASEYVVFVSYVGACLGQLCLLLFLLVLTAHSFRRKLAVVSLYAMFLLSFIVPLCLFDSPNGLVVSDVLRDLFHTRGTTGIIAAFTAVSLLLIAGITIVFILMKHLFGWQVSMTEHKTNRSELIFDLSNFMISLVVFVALAVGIWGQPNFMPLVTIALIGTIFFASMILAPMIYLVMHTKWFIFSAICIFVCSSVVFIAVLEFAPVDYAKNITAVARACIGIAGSIAFCFYMIAPMVALRLLGIRLRIPMRVRARVEPVRNVDPLA